MQIASLLNFVSSQFLREPCIACLFDPIFDLYYFDLAQRPAFGFFYSVSNYHERFSLKGSLFKFLLPIIHQSPMEISHGLKVPM